MGATPTMRNWSMRRRTFFILIAVLSLAGFSQLQAQASGTISGTVLDQAAKPIAGATVDIRSEVTGASRQLTSDDNGKFTATDLAVGSYSIFVAAPGFALTTRSGGQINAGATLDIPITLSVQSVSTAITVNE